EAYNTILEASPLWDGKVKTVQVTDAREHTMEVRFLMSAANPQSAFDLRCYVRENMIEYLQTHHPSALPHVRNSVTVINPESSKAGLR
ncbi:MAG: mechanosensitive ion channel family protein, partial [Acidobacteriota bacterium]|nr:mechanosensitive ion channel family protein [Acidobacteriota bacterium]